MVGKIVPSLSIKETIKNYRSNYIRADAIAGISVAAIAIPQAMAYSQLIGAPVTVGLYTTFVAMLIFALFSSSRNVIVGPDAAMAALTGAALLPYSGSSQATYLALISFMAILTGLASLVAVVAKLSFMSEFLSRPILLGYMAGLALVVIASQSPKLFGLQSSNQSNFFSSSLHVLSNLNHAHVATIIFSTFIGLVTYVLAKKRTRLPVALGVLIISLFLSWIFSFDRLGIATVGTIPSGLPLPRVPGIQFNDFQNLVVPAFAIMMISFANTIATARSFAAKTNDQIDSDQELSALGWTSIVTGFFGGMPIAASGARTAVNDQNNAVSQISQLFAAFAVAIALLFLAPVLRYLPLSALAIIVIAAVIRLFDYDELKAIWGAWRSEATLAIITVLGVTFLGIFQGLLLSILLAVVNMIRTSAFPTDAVLGVAEDGSIRDMSRPPKTEAVPGIIMYRFDAPLYFANARYFRQRVLELIDQADGVAWFLWDAETVSSLDSTAATMLAGLIKELKARNITFCIARLKGPVRSTVSKTKRLSRIIQNTPHYAGTKEALKAFEDHQRAIQK